MFTFKKLAIGLGFTASIFLMGLSACGEDNGQTSDGAKTSVPNKQDHPGQVLFKKKCQLCHDFKHKKLGPPLENVMERWHFDTTAIVHYIKDAQRYRDTAVSDYARNLFIEFDRIEMQQFPELSEEEILQILDYLK